MITVLPDELAELLNDASPATDAATDQQVKAFIDEHRQASRPETLAGLTSALRNRFEAGESRHQSTATVTVGAMKEARLGLYPAQAAIDAIAPMFLHAVAKPPVSGKQRAARNGAVAESEFHGILAWAVGQALGADLDEIQARVDEKIPNNTESVKGITVNGEHPNVQPISLTDAHTVFKRWLGDDYDTDALDAVLATAAVEQFDDGSDPVWLRIISGPGAAKTETAQALDGINATVTSAISSDAALLSGTPKRERAKTATGGLLRKIGDRGVLVIKDVTSILSMNRDTRGKVLAALREIYDGRWYREIGAEGGRTIEWRGRIAVVGAVTTAWDTAHTVISTMGDRFVLIRIDSTTARHAAGRKAIGNRGYETQMRAELAQAVAGVIAGMTRDPITVTDGETDVLLAAADLVTTARTGVESDYRGDVIDAHAPEMPTRFAKQLTQIVCGALAIGMNRTDALRLAIRCARDSMPPLRLAIIDDLVEHPCSTPTDVRRRLEKPRATVDRQLQALHILGVVDVEEVEDMVSRKSRWYYSLADHIDPDAIYPKALPDLSVDTPIPYGREERREDGESTPQVCTDISGNGAPNQTPRRPGCLCTDQPEPCYFCQLAANKQEASR
jgi:hypothetical protein